MDELFIQKVLEGQTEEFRFFIRKYKDLGFSVAFSVVKDEFIAADVVQESFVKAYQNLKSFKGQSKFSTWFCRIVINESFKVNRKSGVVLPLSSSLNRIELHENPVAFDELKAEERSYWVSECLNRLPANECLVLRLYYLAENSIKEICEMTGWSEANVKVLMFRGRKNMQELLEKMLDSEVKSII